MMAEEGELMRPLLDRPDVEGQLEPFWEAFAELSTDRPEGMNGVGAIPFGAIDRYADRYGIDDPDEFERFRSIIRAMDGDFLKTQREKAEERSRAARPSR